MEKTNKSFQASPQGRLLRLQDYVKSIRTSDFKETYQRRKPNILGRTQGEEVDPLQIACQSFEIIKEDLATVKAELFSTDEVRSQTNEMATSSSNITGCDNSLDILHEEVILKEEPITDHQLPNVLQEKNEVSEEQNSHNLEEHESETSETTVWLEEHEDSHSKQDTANEDGGVRTKVCLICGKPAVRQRCSSCVNSAAGIGHTRAPRIKLADPKEKYMRMRSLNNEASRRYRQNASDRKKLQGLMNDLRAQEDRNNDLKIKYNQLVEAIDKVKQRLSEVNAQGALISNVQPVTLKEEAILP